jgi:hypothetical protein
MIYLDPSQWNSDDSIATYALEMPTGQYIMDSADEPWSFYSPDNNVLRFEVQPGDHWVSDPATSERDEIAGTTQYAYGASIDVSYQFMIEPGAANTADWLVLGQLHQVDVPGEIITPPPFSVMMIGERMAVHIGWSNSAGVDHNQNIYVAPTDIVRGQYHSMNIAAKFNPSGGGQLVVTCDGQILASYTGPLGIADHTGVFWKEGIYEAASTETMAVDYADLSIATGGSILSPHSTPTLSGTATGEWYSYAPNNIVASKTIINADQSEDVYDFNTSGSYYLLSHLHYDPTGQLTQSIDYNPNGARSFARTVNADGSQLTVDYDADGVVIKSVKNYASGVISTLTYTAGALGERFVQYTNGSSTMIDYGAAGKIVKFVQVNADGSKTCQLFDVTGQPYVTQTTLYNTSGQVASITRNNAAGIMIFNQTFSATGTTTVDDYTSAGVLADTQTTSSSGVVTSKWFATTGNIIATEVLQPNGSYVYDSYNSLGGLTQQTDYVPGVSMTAYNYDGGANSNGSSEYTKNVTAYESGLTFASDGRDDTFKSFGGDAFAFTSDFGTDVVDNFHVAGPYRDLIELSSVIAPSYSSLAIRQSGADTLISVGADDSIRLVGVSAATFSQACVKFAA